MNLNLKPRIFAVLILAFVALALFLSGCKDFSFFSELGIKGGLRVSPSEVTVTISSSVTFTASGGNPPYTYGIASGPGCIDAATGVYTAAAAAGADIVVVTDSTGQSGTASVTVVTTLEALKISPTTASVSVGNSISFVATGGVGPYTFNFQTNNSGGSVTPGGVYTAGSTTGVSDTIIVTDSDTPAQTCSVPAVVSVTGAVTNVDYSISGETFPPSAFVGSGISGDFTIHNGGSATGTASISWWLFISEDGTFGGDGEHLVDSGTVTTDIPASGDNVVAPTGNWPSDLPQGNYDLFVMVSSSDDLDHGNNVSTASAFTLNVPDVDYRVPSVINLGETRVGGVISGQFTLDNTGSDDGTQTVTWKAYVSANNSVDVGDTLIDTNTEGAMTSAEVPRTILFGGTWPSSPGSYYLVVEVIAGDDAAAGNDGDNTTATGSTIAVTVADIDYYADAISSTGGIAGDTLSCSFDLNNAGGDASGATVTWNLYVSTNATLDAGDYLATSGTAGPLGAGPSLTTVNPGGAAWPTTPRDYYLIVEIESSEDVAAGNDGNDVAVSGGTFTAAAPRVDYTVSQVEYTGGGEKAPGQPFTGRFIYANDGPLAEHNGARSLSWTAYASRDTNLDAEDVGVASGNGLSPLDLGTSSSWIDFSGTWSLDYGDYYLIVKATSLDDEMDTANDWDYSAAATRIGVYTDLEPNDEYQNLPGGPGGYNILFGTDPATPIVLEPGMSIKIEGTDIGSSDTNDTFMFNAGTANTITFTLIWSTSTDCLDIWVYEAGGPAPPANDLVAIGGLADLLSASTIKGPGADEFLENQDLWFNVFYNKAGGNAGTYTAIITAN